MRQVQSCSNWLSFPQESGRPKEWLDFFHLFYYCSILLFDSVDIALPKNRGKMRLRFWGILCRSALRKLRMLG
jgi:hypothetical protein